MNVGQLFVKLGFKQDEKANGAIGKFMGRLETIRNKVQVASTKVKESLSNGMTVAMKDSELAMLGPIGNLAKFIGMANMARMAIMAVVAGLVKLTMSAAAASEHLFKFSINTGMDTDALQKWQQQAGQAGVEAEEVANSFKMLQEKSMEVQLGQGDAGAFQMAGVNWVADAETQMQQIQEMLKSRPAGMGTKLAKDMGLSEDMIAFLRMRDSMEPAQEGMILSKEEIADLKDFNMKLTGAWNSMKMALVKIGAMIAPITKPLIMLFQRLMLAVSDFTTWLNGLGKYRNWLIGIAAGIATAIAAFFFPIVATTTMIAAIIAGVVLLIDDIASFLRGDDSLIGRMAEGMKGALGGIVDWLLEKWRGMIDWITAAFSALGKIISGLWGKVTDIPGKIGELVSGTSGKNGGMASGAWKIVKELFGSKTPEMNPTPAMAGAVSGGGVNQQIQIQIDGAKDPRAVADEVNARLKRETSNSLFQMPRSEM